MRGIKTGMKQEDRIQLHLVAKQNTSDSSASGIWPTTLDPAESVS